MNNNTHENLYDMVVIGAGPAGLTAAIYMSRARYKTLVLEKGDIGGQITITQEVVNYPGVKKTSGKQLTQDMAIQAKSFGAVIKNEEVVGLNLDGDIKKIITKNNTYDALTVVIATGANPRKLGFKGEKEFQGRGVAYCATCDGEFFTGKDIFVVGGGFAACEEGIFLTRYANKVTMLVREENFTAAKSIADQVRNHPKIETIFNVQLESIEGNTFPQKLTYKNNDTGKLSVYEVSKGDTFGTFVFAGYVPNTTLVKEYIKLDDMGYVITQADKMTNIEGVFAAGDLCVKNLRQVVTATADGAIAATSAEKHAQKLHQKLGINPLFDESTIIKEEDISEKTSSNTNDGELITNDMKEQLSTVFSKFEKKLIAIFNVNNTNIGKELEQYALQMNGINDNFVCEIEKISDDKTPHIILKDEEKKLGYKYVGVPGGHEFTSFVLTLYNYSGKGQSLEDKQLERIKSITTPLDINIVVSLSCTKCPDLVTATSQITGKIDGSNLTVSDIGHSKELKDKYNIMSVPCMIINDNQVVFGKKSVDELLDILGK